jgi:hypothetical protein
LTGDVQADIQWLESHGGEDEASPGSVETVKRLRDVAFIHYLEQRAANRKKRSVTLEDVIEAVSRKLEITPGELLSDSREDCVRLGRALVTQYAIANKIATRDAVARRLGRNPATLSESSEQFRKRRPELFDLPLTELLGAAQSP